MYKFKRENWCSKNCKYKFTAAFSKKIHREDKPICIKFNEENEYYTELDFPVIDKTWQTVFNANFEKTKFPKTSKNGLVIVENRCDERLAFVIKNMAYYIPNWKLHIFHSEENKAFIQEILGKHKATVVLHQLKYDIKTNQDYNKVLLDINFWEELKEHERVLIFQTDTMMLQSGIEDFLHYDYVGAPWKWWFRHFKTYNRIGGNGGFSLRKVSKMKEIIHKYKGTEKIDIPEYHNEDVFFSYHLYHDKEAVLPNWNTSMLFSSEAIMCAKTLAIHQAWKFHKNFKPNFKKRKNK